MKLIKCVVRAEKVDETAEALKTLDLSGLTISNVCGRGEHEEYTGFYRGIRYQVRLLPKVMIDVVRVVTETARTGAVGDGRIFVMDVEEAYSIRTRQGGLA